MLIAASLQELKPCVLMVSTRTATVMQIARMAIAVMIRSAVACRKKYLAAQIPSAVAAVVLRMAGAGSRNLPAPSTDSVRANNRETAFSATRVPFVAAQKTAPSSNPPNIATPGTRAACRLKKYRVFGTHNADIVVLE
jgi:hypothetical protein